MIRLCWRTRSGRRLKPGDQPGRWTSLEEVYVDLLVPEALAGPGRRGADLGVHGRTVARRAKGLEGALVDRSRHTIGALGVVDSRSYEIWIAGPAALLVAKVHKIAERVGSPARESDKDALDVLRLLRASRRPASPGNLTCWDAIHFSGGDNGGANALQRPVYPPRRRSCRNGCPCGRERGEFRDDRRLDDGARVRPARRLAVSRVHREQRLSFQEGNDAAGMPVTGRA